jgi:hypothetical protein
MTRITTGCPRCGRVELDAEDVTLVRSPREDAAWYIFDCTGCAYRVVKPAPTSVALALTSVQVTAWTVPAEVLERVRPDEQPPLGVDDLLDILLWLRTDPDPNALLRSPSPGEAENRPARPNAA